MTTTPSPRGSLAAPMLVLLGPVVTVVALLLASAGAPLQLVHEAGWFAFVALGALFVGTLAVAAVVFAAPRGAAVAMPIMLVPWAIMALAALLGAGLVAEAVYHADPASQATLVGVGSAEIMASRTLGASTVLGGALALSAAFLVLSFARAADGAGARVPGSGLAGLVLLGVAAVASTVLVDASVLRDGLAAASVADASARATLLADTLGRARATSLALLAALALTALLGLGMVILALQRRAAGGALLVAVTWLGGVVFGAADVSMVHYIAATLAIPPPWASEPDFVPLALDERAGTAGSVVCLATVTRVRCPGGDAPYDALDGALPRPNAAVAPSPEGLLRGVTLAGEPALEVALDARLPAPALRQLLEAAVRAGYRSLRVTGAFTPPAFREGDVPPLLRSQALVTPSTTWLLTLAVSGGGDGLAPVAIEVRDDDTAESVARRAGAVVDQSVLVVPAALPSVAPAAPPAAPPANDLAGLLGGAADAAPAPADSPLDAPAISRVIRSQMAPIRTCYERGLLANPDLDGRTMVHFTIDPSGAVSDVSASPTIDAPAVLRCIEAVVARMTFPADAAREPISINYPFVFSANR